MKFQIWTLVSLVALSLASPLSPTPLSPAQIPRDAPAKRQTPLNLFLGFLLEYLPAINGPLEAVTQILTAFEQLLAVLTWQQTTYNDLSGSCKPYTVLFARGTTEPGNVGILVGPPFFEALRDRVGASNLAIQGVNGYRADVEGYLAGGDAGGSTSILISITMGGESVNGSILKRESPYLVASHKLHAKGVDKENETDWNRASQINGAKTKCPNTKLILGGYSQGGQIVHNAASLLSAETASWVSKVVIFGDPLSLKPVANIAPAKVKVYCHAGDAICINGALILPPHLTYAIDATAAATFATS